MICKIFIKKIGNAKLNYNNKYWVGLNRMLILLDANLFYNREHLMYLVLWFSISEFNT